MATSIVDHLRKAATAASADRQESNSLALWDIHLACEKSIKSLLSQRHISYPKTHSLTKLTSLLSDSPLENAARRLTHRLPSDSVVMRHRYLQESKISPNKLYVLYSLGLKFCLMLTSQIERRIKIGDASFFLRKPPWFSQLE
jgi:HEPN domain-containing protein